MSTLAFRIGTAQPAASSSTAGSAGASPSTSRRSMGRSRSSNNAGSSTLSGGGSASSGRRRNPLGRAIFHKEKHSAAFPALSNASLSPSNRPRLCADQHGVFAEDFFGERAGRSSSCCETQGFMKRPSCCSDYFEATGGSRASGGGARVPLFRTHSMGEISELQSVGLAPVSEPMVVYYNKMARLSPVPSGKDRPKRSPGVRVPAPDPMFLRRLGTRVGGSQVAEVAAGAAGDDGGDDGGDDESVVPKSSRLGESAGNPSQELAFAELASVEPPARASTPQSLSESQGKSQGPPGRLSRITQRLVGGLPFSGAPWVSAADASAFAGVQSVGCDLSPGSVVLLPPEESISTFVPDTQRLSRPVSPASPEQPPPPQSANRRHPQQQQQQQQRQQAKPHRMPELMSKRMGANASVVRLAARRNSSALTIPTAGKALPPFLPNIFALASTSPACTSFQHAEVVTANTAAISPSLYHHHCPASADCANGVVEKGVLVPPFGAAASITPATATAAHGMLCRLAKANANAGASHASRPLLQTPAASAMPDVHEEWERFISECMATEAIHCGNDSVVPDVDDQNGGAAGVPEKKVAAWFARLEESKVARLHALVCRGVPAEYRRQVWMECAGALAQPVCEGYQCAAIEAIELDLVRAEENPPLSASLRCVLYGYALAKPAVGYCQGMDKIVYGLLRAGLSSSESLALLHSLLDRILPVDMFTAPMSRVLDDQRVLEMLVARRLPRLAQHLQKVGSVSLAPVTVSWFLTLLVDCLPEAHLLRVWDVLFLRGYPAVFEASLGVLELMQSEILCCWTCTSVYELLQNVRQYMDVVDVDEFGRLAFCNSTRACIGMSDIEAIRQKAG